MSHALAIRDARDLNLFSSPYGSPQSPYQQPSYPGGAGGQIPGADKKMIAGICGILLGAFGVHKFLLGYTTEGLIMCGITVLTCGMLAIVPSIIGLVEGIMYLTKSDQEFVATYVQGRKGWF
jgi:TM2 domain-containing membrane protein YozV